MYIIIKRPAASSAQADVGRIFAVDATTVGRLQKREWAKEAKRLANGG